LIARAILGVWLFLAAATMASDTTGPGCVVNAPIRTHFTVMLEKLSGIPGTIETMTRVTDGQPPARWMRKAYLESIKNRWSSLLAPFSDSKDWIVESPDGMNEEQARFSGALHDLRGLFSDGNLILDKVATTFEQSEEFDEEVLAADLKAVDDLVDTASVRLRQLLTDDAPARLKPLSVNRLFDQVTNRLRGISPRFQLVVTRPTTALYLQGDRDLLTDAITNILRNSMEHGYDESVDIAVLFVRAHEQGGRVQIEIGDFGRGMTATQASRIFQLRVTSGSQAGNTGLGLPQVKRIVETEHGGTVTLDSVLHQGSTFSLTFPRLNIEPEVPFDAASRAAEVRPDSILLIEDATHTRVTLATHLRKHGFTVIDVEKSHEGLQIYRQVPTQFRLVLVDRSAIQHRHATADDGSMGTREDVDWMLQEFSRMNPDIRTALVTGEVDPALADVNLREFSEGGLVKPINIDPQQPGFMRRVYQAMGRPLP
jgi:ActR/RegA family two-component response regulator